MPTLQTLFHETSQDLDKVDAAMSCAMHNMKYRNPAEFTLVLTGEAGRGGADVLLPETDACGEAMFVDVRQPLSLHLC